MFHYALRCRGPETTPYLPAESRNGFRALITWKPKRAIRVDSGADSEARTRLGSESTTNSGSPQTVKPEFVSRIHIE
ncbi:hypothetical protein EVAR_30321_1 [Eumeta japonica]|uniref:Uncharacterized protein n=1 Tax=Eumeta variegata TaxID=151549 RepID=A0A4C1WBT9_EUMVA|nr:hypothetical protein EVAR_30321_1 [Eumeta japonica]